MTGQVRSRFCPGLQCDSPHGHLAIHKSRWQLVVHRSQGRNVADELIQEGRLQQVGLFRNGGLFGKYHVLGCSWVGGQEAPVDVAPVPQVRVVAVLGGQTQHVLDEIGRVRGPLEEEFDDGGEELELHLRVLVVEVLKEGSQWLIHIVDAVTVLTEDPDHRGPREKILFKCLVGWMVRIA